MAEHEYIAGTDSARYSGKLWSDSPIAQAPLLLLAELASELSTATDFEALQQILSRKLRWMLNFDRCTLAVRSEYSNASSEEQPISSRLASEYLLFEITSPSRAKSITPQKISIYEGWSGKVLIDSKPRFIDDLNQSSLTNLPPNPDWGIAPQARSVMLLPLRIGKSTIGSLNFSSNTIEFYSTTWRNLASLLASLVGGQLASVLTQVQLKTAYEFRERVMESATDAIYTLDLEGNFTLVNQRTAEITGYSVEELLGLPFSKLFCPQETTWIQNLLLTTINRGISTKECYAELVRKDGRRKIIVFNLAPLLLEGRISAIVSTAQDITERKQAESALLRVKVAEAANLALECQVQERTLQLQQVLDFEARLKRITDKVRDSLDESQIVQAAVMELVLGLSVGCCNMAFYNLERGTSTIYYEYATFIPASQGHIAQMADFPELYRQLLENQYFQFCSIVPNPVRGRVAMLACPIFDDQGVLGDLWLINQQDHSFNELEIRLVQQVANQCAIAIRQARLYQAATAQVEELEKLNALKDDFLSTVSHELRTPVSNMKMAIQMLRIAPTVERRERYLEILQNECKREIELINTLLDLQQLEATTSYSISPEVVSLQDWLPTIIEPFRLRTQERQQILRVDLSPSLPPLLSDPSSLGRILAELLNNACKYTPENGEIALSVRNQSRAAGEDSPPASLLPLLCFSIRNSTEIPETELPRIFEKFYRVPSADPWKEGGTGLGLALVQKLVEKLEGNIQVKSSHGWTTFTVELCPVVTTEQNT